MSERGSQIGQGKIQKIFVKLYENILSICLKHLFIKFDNFWHKTETLVFFQFIHKNRHSGPLCGGSTKILLIFHSYEFDIISTILHGWQ